LAVPTSKFDRVVLSGRLVEAALSLVVQAQSFAKFPREQAADIRNDLGLECFSGRDEESTVFLQSCNPCAANGPCRDQSA
jgi:hypothetical protein